MDDATRVALAEHLDRVRHDLGRYVAFAVRGLDPTSQPAEREDALRADLLSTRRAPSGVVDAPTLWAELRRPLVGEGPLPGGAQVDLGGSAELVAVDAAMAEVAAACDRLRGAPTPDEVERGIAAAYATSEAVRALVKAFRRATPAGPAGRGGVP